MVTVSFCFVQSGDVSIRVAWSGSRVATSGGSEQMVATRTVFPAALLTSLKLPAGTSENGIRADFDAPPLVLRARLRVFLCKVPMPSSHSLA